MLEKQQALFTVLALAGGFALAPALYAEESSTPQNSHDSMMSPGTMGHDGMMNMMEGMPQMGDMMDHCSQMMNGGMDGGSGRPNEQWRENASSPDNTN